MLVAGREDYNASCSQSAENVPSAKSPGIADDTSINDGAELAEQFLQVVLVDIEHKVAHPDTVSWVRLWLLLCRGFDRVCEVCVRGPPI